MPVSPLSSTSAARALAAVAVLAAPAPAALTAQGPSYGREVRPILADHCFACHGPDAAAREADLRLDRRDEATADRDGIRAVVPGDAGSSELIRRVTDDADPMPPDDHERLTTEQVDVLRRWIDAGAEYDRHWAYAPRRRPEPPAVRRAAWPRNEIDRFVLRGLEREGLEPTPAADPRTLVRRLSFDLLGLPPTPEQVEAFAADPSDAAWDALVEEMLASPHHAERLTTFWFDLVRFADTTGIHADNRWNVAPYRDWVIEAFGSNMPFDRFTVEQIAGDLLPGATRSQKVAAAYNRLNLVTREGGSQPKEFLIRYTADRTRNLADVWLASSIGCCECHDHKFDPLPTREFYELGAFFADIEQVGVYSRTNTYEPEMAVPSPAQETRHAELTAALAEVRAMLDADTPELEADARAFESALASQPWRSPSVHALRSEAGATLVLLDDGSIRAEGVRPEKDTYDVVLDAPPKPVRALRIELLSDPSLPEQGPGRADNGNVVLGEVEVLVDGESVGIARARATYEQGNFAVERLHDGRPVRGGWAVMRGKRGTPAEAVLELAEAIPPAEPGPGSGPGAEREGDADAQPADQPPRITVRLHQQHGSFHVIGRMRLTWATDPGLVAVDPTDRRALERPVAERGPEVRARLRALHRAHTPLLAEARARRADLEDALSTLDREIPRVMVTRSVEPMEIRVRPRGNWMDDSGDVVLPDVPTALGPPLQRRVDADGNPLRPTRLDLARWLVRPDHPLTARVLANRIWRMLLGRGIVRTLDDFGVQGTEPVDPDLLDHLATRLVDSGWDLRGLIRAIVRSSTYRQASWIPEEAVGAGGSEARLQELFGRQRRFRLDAEFVRDQALAASGLLVREIGGESVRPYQPAGYWAHLNFPRRTYRPSTGDALYRRALYGHWQRQFVHPSLLAFDAPSRERCTAERPRSNTPQAALALLNDPIFVEAARVLAERVLHESGADDTLRVRTLWRICLQRQPSSAECRTVLALVAGHRAHYAAREGAALDLLSTGDAPRDEDLDPVEHAAWTSAARVALNLHETIVRD